MVMRVSLAWEDRVGGARRDALRNAVLDDAFVWHLGTKGRETPAHRRGASQEHTVGCSRQKKIAVPRRETRSYFSSSVVMSVSPSVGVVIEWWHLNVLASPGA